MLLFFYLYYIYTTSCWQSDEFQDIVWNVLKDKIFILIIHDLDIYITKVWDYYELHTFYLFIYSFLLEITLIMLLIDT